LGDELFSMWVIGVVWRTWRVDFFIFVGLERPVFAPPIALTASSLWL
jgi:hypothetical protein